MAGLDDPQNTPAVVSRILMYKNRKNKDLYLSSVREGDAPPYAENVSREGLTVTGARVRFKAQSIGLISPVSHDKHGQQRGLMALRRYRVP
jgi:hypothetical protein